MENELLKVFDSEGTLKGTASRAEVHQKGLWHETFHCWFLSKEDGRIFITFSFEILTRKTLQIC
jgi:hypothetical protein